MKNILDRSSLWAGNTYPDTFLYFTIFSKCSIDTWCAIYECVYQTSDHGFKCLSESLILIVKCYEVALPLCMFSRLLTIFSNHFLSGSFSFHGRMIEIWWMKRVVTGSRPDCRQFNDILNLGCHATFASVLLDEMAKLVWSWGKVKRP